jgi:deazaflavin-dependent oxidoreductase (nitroreductase family)
MVDLTTRPEPTPFSERIGLICVRYMEAINTSLYRLSDGRIGSTIWGQPVILLTASGRTTGIRRTKPLLALPDGPNWIVVASRGGTSGHPEWFLNLMAYEERVALGTENEPPALAPPTIEVGDQVMPVRAAVLEDPDRATWWAHLIAVYPRFESYQARSPQRRIEVLRLTPTH